MKLALTREARALALAALGRGLIEPRALWDAACRWTLGGATSPRELFTGVLTPEQVDELYRSLPEIQPPPADTRVPPSVPPSVRASAPPVVSDGPASVPPSTPPGSVKQMETLGVEPEG